MKKLILLGAVVMIFALMGGVALAETPHGPFDSDTSLCAACHRAHTSTAEYLLATPKVTVLCVGCHDGTGADTDVVNGAFLIDGTENTPADHSGYEHATWGAEAFPLMGGGFNNIKTGGDAGVATQTTSRHMDPKSAGDGGATTFPVQWGQGTTGPGRAKAILDCVDCHMPHATTSYRMLRVKPTGYNGGDLIVPEYDADRIQSTTGPYDKTSNPGRRYTEDSGMFNTTIQTPTVATAKSISKWCGLGCHDYYYRGAVRADNGSGEDAGKSPAMHTTTAGLDIPAGACTSITVADPTLTPVNTVIYVAGQKTTVSAVAGSVLTVGSVTFAANVVVGTPVAIQGAGMEVYYDLDGVAGNDPGYMHAVDVNMVYQQRNVDSPAVQNLYLNLGTDSMYPNMLPVADVDGPLAYSAGDIMTCLTCHRAHGTDAPMEDAAVRFNADDRELSGAQASYGSLRATNASMLLRLSNRAVCEVCHNMPSGF